MSQLMYNVGNDLSFIWYVRKVIHLAFITILHLSFMIRPLQNKTLLSSTYYISIFVGTSDGSGCQMSGSGRVRVLKFFSGSGRVGF